MASACYLIPDQPKKSLPARTLEAAIEYVVPSKVFI